MSLQVAISTDEDAQVTFQVHYSISEFETLAASLVQLTTQHEDLLRDYGQTQLSTSETREKLADLTQKHSLLLEDRRVVELEEEGKALALRKIELQSLLSQRSQQSERLEQVVRDQDFRRKNADQLVGLAESESKERIETGVKEEKELSEWKKRATESQAELKRAQQDLAHETVLTAKRDEQLQLLLTQLQKREMEQEQLRRDLRRKEEEQQRLQQRLADLQARAPSHPSTALEEARGVAAAKQGEVAKVSTTQAKEMFRGYHQQLLQKQAQVQLMRKQADTVRLPPLKSAGSDARRSIGDLM